MIAQKSAREIRLMKEAGRIVSLVFKTLKSEIKPGMSTLEVDKIARDVIISNGGIPTFKDYNGFPGNVCVSVNDTLIHGIGRADEIIKDGDIVTVDVGVTKDSYIADAARTFLIGNVAENARKLVEVTEESFWHAVNLHAKPGENLSNISHAIEGYGTKHGYTLTSDFTGHGVGRKLHEPPVIPNVGTPGHGPILKEGMTLAIEPMLNEGRVELITLKDGWTVKTKDGKLASHYENTIVITKDGYEVITMGEE
ncbi:MAG TPA: type I methionyl aminopeptidase [Bacilli bacterium]|nr:type I methionyl aminopeptidase [Bacilli bacterium]